MIVSGAVRPLVSISVYARLHLDHYRLHKLVSICVSSLAFQVDTTFAAAALCQLYMWI